MEQGGLNSRNVESLNWRMSVCFASNHHSIPFTFIFCRPILYVIAHILRLPWSLHDVVVVAFLVSVAFARVPTPPRAMRPCDATMRPCDQANPRSTARSLTRRRRRDAVRPVTHVPRQASERATRSKNLIRREPFLLNNLSTRIRTI